MSQQRSVFFISDGTGITSETLGQTLLTQFPGMQFELQTIPYINTPEKAADACEMIAMAANYDQLPPIVFVTLIDPVIRSVFSHSPGVVIDFFGAFIPELEKSLNIKAAATIGRSHGLKNLNTYMLRMEAVNYALAKDDGMSIHDYEEADVILVGVSRCGKTPTSLYLAMQFGIFAANHPFTEDDMTHLTLPKELQVQMHKLFGLTIDPLRLREIREQRRANSTYSSLKQCQLEVTEVEQLYKTKNIPYLDTTSRSIEELAAEILVKMHLKRRLYQ